MNVECLDYMPLKILIVDDEAELVESCARFLSLWGHLCLCAYRAEDAICVISAEKPDVVITDLNLPDGSGLDVLRYTQIQLPKSGRVLITAYHSSQNKSAAYAAGASAYLRKPFSMAELSATVRNVSSPGPFSMN